MRHLKEGRKLGRTSSHRKALLRNMVASLFEFEKIETTDAKAKELRKVADKMITWGKRGDLHARRQALKVINNKKTVQKLFDDIAPRFRERRGGYSRIIKAGRRKGDNAPLSIIELVAQEEAKTETRRKKEAKEAKGKPAKGSLDKKQKESSS
jgi:large subunit ribosomal protein L17